MLMPLATLGPSNGLCAVRPRFCLAVGQDANCDGGGGGEGGGDGGEGGEGGVGDGGGGGDGGDGGGGGGGEGGDGARIGRKASNC